MYMYIIVQARLSLAWFHWDPPPNFYNVIASIIIMFYLLLANPWIDHQDGLDRLDSLHIPR